MVNEPQQRRLIVHTFGHLRKNGNILKRTSLKKKKERKKKTYSHAKTFNLIAWVTEFSLEKINT